MKYLDEYRDGDLTRKLLNEINQTVTRPWKIMEVCGGQTHSIIKSGLDQLLSPEIDLVHGPGCPVCVTPLELIDKAIALASRPEIIFTSYGDMLRVPGSERDLFSVKAEGGDVRIVYSPLDALKIASQNPDKTIVFFGIGFETTAPANAMAVVQAKNQAIENFAMLVSHVTVPPALTALLESPDVQVNAFLHYRSGISVFDLRPAILKLLYTHQQRPGDVHRFEAHHHHRNFIFLHQLFVFPITHHRANMPGCQESIYLHIW
jgi:hydrogenase expression/formation protein HypD